jgi:hypothetical protein
MYFAKQAVGRAGRIDGGLAEKNTLLRFRHVLDRTTNTLLESFRPAFKKQL